MHDSLIFGHLAAGLDVFFLVLVLVASLQWVSQQRCVRRTNKGKTYTAGF